MMIVFGVSRTFVNCFNYLLAQLFLLFCAVTAMAAVSCELNNPASDVPRLFPGSTSFSTSYFSFAQSGGEPLLRKVESRLGKSPALYAPLNVPYTLYEIYRDKKKIGYVHGVNQKGQFGVLEVFVSLDMEGTIKVFYIQRIAGKWASKFTSPRFGRQFVGLTLKDFEQYDPVSGKGSGKVSLINNPAPEAVTDFFGLLRAVKKNLVLMDEFFYSKNR
ncbi:hypothetical protein KI809_09990 [Geobacter pelophilus]|uniref:FMN-binding domain-containing protein n=1 Tax=Geoanaerobacter pelophilus TaxID=60036 RepID=A0AAW4L6G7_9BACT|nr:hypothetical protein [Geoanaerobacter pelophilus]MBT0664628.1 hypothetical protein [Geoanaerobacter pelophilus]